MIKIFKISGDSLYPLYKEGEFVVGIRLNVLVHVKSGDIVIFQHQSIGTMIKKIRTIQGSSVFVEGTTPQSLDSRVFGTIPLHTLTHKVLFKLPNVLVPATHQ